MRIFSYKIFYKWAKSENLANEALILAINEMKKGLFDATLGSGLYKKRVAKLGRGKSSGYRTILAFKSSDKAFFIYGFSKSEKSNLTESELQKYRLLGKSLLNITEGKLTNLINEKILFEVSNEKEK